MGYYSDFEGTIDVFPALDADKGVGALLSAWLEQRHVTLEPAEIMEKDPDWEAHLICGKEIEEGGWNYIYDSSDQHSRTDIPYGIQIVDYNVPPGPCPSLWSDLRVTEDGSLSAVDGKAYSIPEWLELVCNILDEWKFTANGTIIRHGEDEDDNEEIFVSDNCTTTECIASDAFYYMLIFEPTERLAHFGTMVLNDGSEVCTQTFCIESTHELYTIEDVRECLKEENWLRHGIAEGDLIEFVSYNSANHIHDFVRISQTEYESEVG